MSEPTETYENEAPAAAPIAGDPTTPEAEEPTGYQPADEGNDQG